MVFQNPVRLTYALQIDTALKSIQALKAHACTHCLAYETRARGGIAPSP